MMLMRQLTWARLEAGWSQAYVAARSGYTREEVCRWENGRRTPSLKQIEDLAASLGFQAVLMPAHWDQAA